MKPLDLVGQAFKNIGRQKLRSVLTIFAVTIGATSVTIMLALVTGAQTFFVSQFSANGTLQQIAVSAQTDLSKFSSGDNGGNCDSCIKLTDAVAAKIKALPHVIGIARRVGGGQLESVTYNGSKLQLQQVVGYDANGILTNTMLAGRDITDSDKDGVITVTSDYADKWGFKGHYGDLVNKTVQLTTRNGYSGVGATIQQPQQGQPGGNQPGNNPQQQAPTVLTATIVGVADGGDNGKTVRAPLPWVIGMNEQQMYQQTAADQKAMQAAQNQCSNRNGVPCQPPQMHMTLITTNFLDENGYNGFTAKVDNPTNAAATTAAIKKLGLGAADAQSQIQQQLQIFNILSLVLGGIGGIALLVAAIGVVNTMVMAILERTREIGVLRACGATRATIRRMFTLEASTLGFLGGVTGVLVGWGLSLIANTIINKQLAGGTLAAHNIITLPIWLIGSVIGIATLIGMLAGLYPAFRAARLNPIDALRYE